MSQTGETIAAVVQVAVNGPKSEEGLFQKPEAGSSVSAPTAFARRRAGWSILEGDSGTPVESASPMLLELFQLSWQAAARHVAS